MRLGFITARGAEFVDGRAFVDPGVGRLVDALGRRSSRLFFAAARAPDPIRGAHRLEWCRGADLYPLPVLRSLRQGFLQAPAFVPQMRAFDHAVDAFVVQLPFAAPLALLALSRPRVLHVCADIEAIAGSTPLYSGLRRIPALAAGRGIGALYRWLSNLPNARVLANGGELLAKLGGRGRAVVSSTLFERELGTSQRRRPSEAPFRVLYVGYLRAEKGIDVLLTAFERLLDDLPDAELEIVGAKDSSEHGTGAALRAQLERVQRKGTVRLLPGVPFGPELFQHFADADVLALPSRSEGTPRVLVEARAFGCPVVASNVGGVPTSVTHGVDGLLVPPEDAPALRRALHSLAVDRDLHARLVAAGLERARSCTVERFADAMWEELQLLVPAARH